MQTRAGRRGEPLGPIAWLRMGVDRFAAASPARFAIVIFTALILILTSVLALPISSASGRPTPIVDAL
ncbi:MAG: TrkH family potassium uptake protein, partial [Rhodoglobus sp.]|nr:TrkH family potassium uptake protein [Rhodoglobus sp.]